MQKGFDFTELSIVILAENHNPTILNPDFLKFNGIVPKEWVVSKPPLCAHPISQVEYENGMRITAELNKLIFFTPKFANNHFDRNISDVAKRYVETLRHVNYKAVGINPRGHFSFDNAEALTNYFANKLLCKGAWADFCGGVRSVSIKLRYELESAVYNIGLDQASLRSGKSRENNLLSISGNFHHDIGSKYNVDSYRAVCKIIDNMGFDLDQCLNFCKLLPEA
ncbi:MAG: hypothetical protein JRI80_12490 [Deltaproteobacteria bacterium]|nr:hypothetical protein [Deltaproteobacteria bacterium]